MEFLYKNLSPDEFEDLAQDVLSSRLRETFEKFKPGKDGGIDLRLIRNEDVTVIAQVKHMIGSYGSTHRSVLRRESEKFRANLSTSNIERYILILSCSLSSSNKSEILRIFQGRITTEADIIGIEDIEQTLRENEEIVRRHFKLWLSSTHVLYNILNNKTYGKSEFYFKKIVDEKVRLFVKTQNIDSALSILNNQKVLVITGDPGIGKTTLSELLCLYYSGQDYQFVYCDDTDEAENVFTKDAKQIFLLDDFLGSNYLEVFSSRAESKILRFIDRIRDASDKALILNSRTAIYKQAGNRGIHWERQHWPAFKFSLDLAAYDELDRARMLYNHLKHKGINDEYFQVIRSNKAYFDIINHKNFSPRTIETITSRDRLLLVKPEDYVDFAQRTLDNPFEIWKTSYRNQIGNHQRWLLQTLFTLKGDCDDPTLRKAFRSRLNYEKEMHGQPIGDTNFNDCTAELLDAFIVRSLDIAGGSRQVRWTFVNPSIFDYLAAFISENENLLESLARPIIHLKQWETILSIPSLRQIAIDEQLLAAMPSTFHEYGCNDDLNQALQMLKICIDNGLQMADEIFVSIAKTGLSKLPKEVNVSVVLRIFHELRSRSISADRLVDFGDASDLCINLLCSSRDIDEFEELLTEFDHFFGYWASNSNIAHQSLDIRSIEDWRIRRKLNQLAYREAEQMVAYDSIGSGIVDINELSEHVLGLKHALKERFKSLGFPYYKTPSDALDIDIEGQIRDNRNRISSDEEAHGYDPLIDSAPEISDVERIINVFKS